MDRYWANMTAVSLTVAAFIGWLLMGIWSAVAVPHLHPPSCFRDWNQTILSCQDHFAAASLRRLQSLWVHLSLFLALRSAALGPSSARFLFTTTEVLLCSQQDADRNVRRVFICLADITHSAESPLHAAAASVCILYYPPSLWQWRHTHYNVSQCAEYETGPESLWPRPPLLDEPGWLAWDRLASGWLLLELTWYSARVVMSFFLSFFLKFHLSAAC